MRIILSLLIVAGFLTSCDTTNVGNIDQDDIRTVYTMDYFESTQKTIAQAQLIAQDTNSTLIPEKKIILAGPALLEFNRSSFREVITASSGDYVMSFEKDRIEYGEFRFRDLKGTMYINHIPMAYDIHIDYTSNFIPGDGSDLTLEWLGLPVGKNERVSVNLKNTGRTSFSNFFYQEQDSAKSIVIPGDDLIDLPKGEYEMSITRTYRIPLLDSSEAGGYISSSYVSNPVLVNL